jgi:hypothetical protein
VNRQLIRHDESMMFLPWTLCAAGLIGLTAGLVTRDESVGRGVAGIVADAEDRMVQSIILTLQLGVLQFVLGRTHLRASPYQLGLPLDARDVWLSRMAAILITVMGPCLIGFVVFWVASGLGADTSPIRVGGNVLALLVVLPLVYQCRRTRAHRADASHPVLHWLIYAALAVTAAALLGWHGPSFAWVAPSALLLAGALGLLIWRSLPVGFELAAGAVVTRRERGRRLPGWLTWLARVPLISPFAPLNRAMRVHVLMTLNLVSLALGMLAFLVVSFQRGVYIEVYSLVLIQVLLFWIALLGVPRLIHLPLSRDRLLVQCLVPGFALVAAGLGVGFLVSPDLDLRGVFSSNRAAAGTGLYVLLWGLLTAALLLLFRTSAATTGARVGRWAMVLGFGLVGLGALAVAMREIAGTARLPEDPVALIHALGDGIPLPAAATWLCVLVLAATTYLIVRALFGRVEYHWLEKRLLKAQEKFS